MPRLPQPGGDAGNWGEILNEFLLVSHTDAGALNPDTVTASHIVAGSVSDPAIADNGISTSKLKDAGAANGVAVLNGTAQLPDAQLPTRLQQDVLNDTYDTLDSFTDWIDWTSEIASPRHTPTLVWSNSSATQLTSPVEYKPSIVGTGSRVTDWNGQNDPNFVFHPGIFNTSNGANQDLALYGTTKPSSVSGYEWPIIAEFDTSSDNSVIEIAMYGSGPAIKLWVNGKPAISDMFLGGPSGMTVSKKLLITFPMAASRRIRIGLIGGAGLVAVRVPTGQSISKPTDTARVGVIVGDSFVNGASSADSWPSGSGLFDTFAMKVLQSLGCNRFVLAGIGGTGFTAGAPATFQSRVAAITGMNPHVMVVIGSVNDGGAAGTIQSAVTTFLNSTASIPERYVIGTVRGGAYIANHDAVRDAALAANVPFVDMRGFINGTGRITAPTGDGNADFFINGDGVHPTFEGHRALTKVITRKLTRIRFS